MHLCSWRLKCYDNQRNSVGTDRENVVPGNLCIIWKRNEAWPPKKDSVTFCRLSKFLILKKGFRHCPRVFNNKKWLHRFLMTLTVFWNSYSGEYLWTAVFVINELHLLWVPNFIALGIYILFGAKFFWNEETDTCFNVECVLLGRNFSLSWWLLGG